MSTRYRNSRHQKFMRKPPFSFYHVAPEKVRNLQKILPGNVVEPDDKTKIPFLLFFAEVTFILPPLDLYKSREFKQFYIENVVDSTILVDLQESRVVNWCVPELKAMYPISTLSDGNCLLHAVSVAMWGCYDHVKFLRRLVYTTLAADESDQFRARWLKDQRDSETYEEKLQLNLTSMQRQIQWEDVVKTAEDKLQLSNGTAMPFESLEAIHIFVLCNILRRPIIVLCEPYVYGISGEPLAYNRMGGIYLPFLWKPTDCIKSPLVLAYHASHFVPMVSMMDSDNFLSERKSKTSKHGVPIVRSDLEALLIHFTLPEEERKSTFFLQNYLELGEISRTIGGQSDDIVYAKLGFKTIPEEYNLMSDHVKYIEHLFRNQFSENSMSLDPPTAGNALNNFDIASGIQPSENHTPLEPSAPPPSFVQQEEIGAVDHNATPATPTRRLLGDENMEQHPVEGNAPEDPMVLTSRSGHVESSVDGVQDTGNRFLGSFPSISGERCETRYCKNFSSVDTYPHCHECHTKFRRRRESELSAGIDEMNETNDFADEDTFGTSPDTLVTHYGRGRDRSFSSGEGDLSDLHGEGKEPFSIPFGINDVNRQCCHPGCKMRGYGVCDAHCPDHYREKAREDLLQVAAGVRLSERGGHQHTNQALGRNLSEGSKPMHKESPCSTPGCKGVSCIDDVCFPCLKNPQNIPSAAKKTLFKGTSPVPSKSVGIGEILEESDTPNRQGYQPQHGDNNTKVPFELVATYPPTLREPAVSARDGHRRWSGQSVGHIPGKLAEPTAVEPLQKCKYPHCKSYGSKMNDGFCQPCFNNICKKKAMVSRHPREVRLVGPPTPRFPCATNGCLIFAEPGREGFCKQCYNKKSRHRASSEPTVTTPVLRDDHTYFDKKCRMEGCTGYGIKPYEGYCKRCYQTDKHARFGASGLPSPTQAPDLDTSFRNVIKDAENACKHSTGRCRRDGCLNYGNSKCGGYCNGCYSDYLRDLGRQTPNM